jgi:hypothetical protein
MALARKSQILAGEGHIQPQNMRARNYPVPSEAAAALQVTLGRAEV